MYFIYLFFNIFGILINMFFMIKTKYYFSINFITINNTTFRH